MPGRPPARSPGRPVGVTVTVTVTVTVPDDGVATVLGHNGAGKSTLPRAAMGLLKPRSGSILLNGEDITHLAPHQRVAKGMAYVPQGRQAFAHLTTAENLQLVADGRLDGKEAVAEPSTCSPSCASCPAAARVCSQAAGAGNSPWPAS
jgi:ABC-type branched-subunit amino acid transport system ATPase component